eukprot:805578-Rhodomonas_salina.1
MPQPMIPRCESALLGARASIILSKPSLMNLAPDKDSSTSVVQCRTILEMWPSPPCSMWMLPPRARHFNVDGWLAVSKLASWRVGPTDIPTESSERLRSRVMTVNESIMRGRPSRSSFFPRSKLTSAVSEWSMVVMKPAKCSSKSLLHRSRLVRCGSLAIESTR